MKAIQVQIALLLILSSFSFRGFDNEAEKCLIRVGETISFSNKPKHETEKRSFSMGKGSYDGSGFELKIDSVNSITLSGISQSKGPKQDDFIIIGCTGDLTRYKEMLTVKFEKCRKGYYLVNLDSSALVGDFDTIIRIVLKSGNPAGKPAEYYCHQRDRSAIGMKGTISAPNGKPKGKYNMETSLPENEIIQLTAVPREITKEELFAAKHPEHTLAHFAKIEIEINGGKIINFPQGSYILCEGNCFTLK